LPDEVFAGIGHVDLVAFGVRERYFTFLDHVVHFISVLTRGVERRAANKHLVSKDADGPPINREPMTHIRQNLRCDVVRRAAESLRLLSSLEHFSETEIGEAEVAVLVHEDVFGFEVAIDDLLFVEVADSHDHLHRIKLHSLLVEAMVFAEVAEQLTATHESHHEEYLGVGLEYVFHADEEGMISHEQNIFLKLGSLDLIVIQDSVLSQRLHRKHFRFIIFQLDKENLPKRTSANDRLNLKIIQSHILSSFGREHGPGRLVEDDGVHGFGEGGDFAVKLVGGSLVLLVDVLVHEALVAGGEVLDAFGGLGFARFEF